MHKILKMVFSIVFISGLLISCKANDRDYEWFVSKINLNQINLIDTSNVTIAILDTGYNKEILTKYKDNIDSEYNFVNNSISIESSITYHASNIISLILGDVEVYGYSNNAKVVPIVVADDYGHTNSKLLSDGIYYAVENHAQIICISMGSYVDYDDVRNAINYALINNVIVIAASGDKGMERIMYPANYNGVYAISAQNIDGSLLANSNYISKCLKVPGNKIKVIEYIQDSNYHYTYSSGSSYSSAIFTCFACNILSVNNGDIFQTRQNIDNIHYDKSGFIIIE